MTPLTQDHVGQSTSIRDVCEKALAEPAKIWDALEAQGIHATPGAIHRTIAWLDAAHHRPGSEAHGAKGLSARDVETMAALVEKAGGAEPLVHLLQACSHPPRS